MNIEITPEIKEAKQRFGIIGNSPALMAAVGRALQVAPIDLSVLINGADYPCLQLAQAQQVHRRKLRSNP